MPTSVSSSITRASACLPVMPMCRRSDSAICSPTVNTGLSDVIGSWKITEMSLPRSACISARSALSRSRPAAAPPAA
jgi:hypothetical protein